MQIKLSMPVGHVQMQVILVFLFLLFAFAGKNNTMVAAITKKSTPKKTEKQQQQLQNWKVMRHSVDVFYPSKRRVPNESDPLHNR
ncbi:hypothetical protein RND71_031619 [Anisodus tanguticus]|uniref:Uncharacterized protein n=1 Tax=Anisodus tanguticus TaxID=243964 RepID=A0AAE1V4Z4_9SOLA|nr:hypothetical protein RND71_031619 [Anisodus tanguticus]